MIKLVGDGIVLIKEFQTEGEGLEYMKLNRYDLMWDYGYYELVVPGEKTIWPVADVLVPAEEYQKQVFEATRERIMMDDTPQEGWDD